MKENLLQHSNIDYNWLPKGVKMNLVWLSNDFTMNLKVVQQIQMLVCDRWGSHCNETLPEKGKLNISNTCFPILQTTFWKKEHYFMLENANKTKIREWQNVRTININ